MTTENNDFARLFEEKMGNLRTTIRTGEKVRGKVTMIGQNTIFVNLGTRADGLLDKKDLLDDDGQLKVKEGDIVEAFCMAWTDEGIKLAVKMSRDMVDSSIEDAFRAGIPVEGKVTGERKGGFTVQVANAEAFCPFSQMDGRGVKKEPAEYIGATFSFLLTEYAEEGRNIVLSRRRILEQEAAKLLAALKETLQVDDIIDGTVTRIMPYGAFVDLGGVEGMVHVSEMSWERGQNPEDLVQEGQKVSVKVLSLDWGGDGQREKLSLSMKQAVGDPWEKALSENRYVAGSRHQGVVSRLADFGAFITLEPGLDGLAHISQLGAEQRVNHPSEVLQPGEKVDVTVLAVDPEKRRLALCIGEPKKAEEGTAERSAEETLAQIEVADGEILEGEVEKVMPFGVFVSLPIGQTGLLHISQTTVAGSGSLQVRALYKAYPLRSKVKVVIREIKGDRISLTLPEILEQEREQDSNMDVKDSADKDFGSLGDLFGQLKL